MEVMQECNYLYHVKFFFQIMITLSLIQQVTCLPQCAVFASLYINTG